MLATDKARIMVYLDPSTDEKLRSLAFKHRKTTNISALTEAMILHCLGNRKFLDSLKKEEEIGCDYLAIDYHLSYYRVACRQLTEGIENPKEFARVESIRDAALCGIALEIGIVTEIGSGKLDRHLWEKAIAFIHRYEQAEVAV